MKTPTMKMKQRMWSKVRRSAWRATALGLAALVGAGCRSDGGEGDPPAVNQKAALVAFSGENACAELEQYIEDTAVTQMRKQLEGQRDGVPSWGWWGGWMGRGVAEDMAGPTAASAGGAEAKAAPTDYTTTNNQVAGVDEADFVKNDGTRIFVLSGDSLHVTKSWPAAETQLRGRLKLEGWPQSMFLDGASTVVVFSSIYQPYAFASPAYAACRGMDCGYWGANATKVTVVDVSDEASPQVMREYFLPGSYQSARKVGGSVRLVLTDDFHFPPEVKWYPDYVEGLYDEKNAAQLRAAYDGIITQNERLIRAQTLAEWVPGARTVAAGATRSLPHACTDFSKVNAPTRLGTVSVVTLKLDAPDSLGRTTILAEPGEIYASTQSLYVATRHWWWWPAPGQTDTTYVHKFDISAPDAAKYRASGTVDGYIVDQFSMDEAASGHFRMATTVTTRVPDTSNVTNWWGRTETGNRVSVLEEKDGRLEVVGRSEDLAKGERIMSSRFIGNKGFVVTFRQVDPLFTFDMTDPTNPKKLGELKVPGFSTYLHPIDENHLLTIGTYQPEPVDGQPVDWNSRAVQLAIFDVSDMSSPKQTFVQLVGTGSSSSEAQYDHKAFNYFAAKKLLAIPFSDWRSGWSSDTEYWSGFTSDLRVFGVDAASGFTPKGALSMSDLYAVSRSFNWSYYWQPAVRRSVMADEFVYAISDSGIRVADVANLSAPLATVRFDRYQP